MAITHCYFVFRYCYHGYSENLPFLLRVVSSLSRGSFPSPESVSSPPPSDGPNISPVMQWKQGRVFSYLVTRVQVNRFKEKCKAHTPTYKKEKQVNISNHTLIKMYTIQFPPIILWSFASWVLIQGIVLNLLSSPKTLDLYIFLPPNLPLYID